MSAEVATIVDSTNWTEQDTKAGTSLKTVMEEKWGKAKETMKGQTPPLGLGNSHYV